nr:PREDICTED: putative leucine-rich repeat-containing protein DDB_G0290503 isoform X2 [Bemisia tabaci]
MPENADTIETITNLQHGVKMAGYLEKRGKLGMMGTRWRRWWCVLEGRLLLYYKSQNEYSNLSPCRGSLNMGLAASVTPARNFQLHVTTRSQLCVLRAKNQVEQERWLQALLDSMTLQPLPSHPNAAVGATRPVQQFRHPSKSQEKDELSTRRRADRNLANGGHILMSPTGELNPFEEMELKDEKIKRLSYCEPPQKNSKIKKQNRYSESFVTGVKELDENFNTRDFNEGEKNESFIFSCPDGSIKDPAIDLEDEIYMNLVNDSLTEKHRKKRIMKNNRRNDPPKSDENSKLYEKKVIKQYSPVSGEKNEMMSSEKLKTRDSLSKDKKMSLQDCRLRIRSDMNLYSDPMGSVERLFTGINKDTRITRRKSNEIKENILKMRSISDACLLKSIYDDSLLPFESELMKSSSKVDLESGDPGGNGKSKSCENVFMSFKLVDSNLSSDSSLDVSQSKTSSSNATKSSDRSNPSPADSTPRRTDSFLKRIITPNSRDVDKVDGVKKRSSFSFFHKLVSKRKIKEANSIPVSEEEDIVSNNAASSQYQQSTESEESNSSFAECQTLPVKCKINPCFESPPSPGPEPRPDYDEYSSDSDSIELTSAELEFPTREETRSKSPRVDISKDDLPIGYTIPPPLPLKIKRLSQNQNPTYVNFILPAQINTLDSIDGTLIKPDFDEIISKNKKIGSEEPLYDVPRPHTALSLTTKENDLHYSLATDSFNGDLRGNTIQEPDSLDVSTKQIFITDTENCLTPDSLEINWCMKKAESWIRYPFNQDIFCLKGEQFQDSLDFEGQSQSHLLHY